MGLSRLLFENPIAFVLLVVPLLYSVIIHEVAHGWVASLLGDDTARRLGRLSLNPVRHLDPIGTLALFFVGFGWAKPVPVNYMNLRDFRKGLIAVSLAGCVANIIIATLALFLLQAHIFHAASVAGVILITVARINIVLGALNLIPIPPLDGSKVLMGFLPSTMQRSFAQLEPYGFFILIFLLFTGLLTPIISFFQRGIIAVISFLLGGM